MKAAIYQFFLQETRAVLEKLSKYWVLVTEFFQDTSNFSLYESEPQPCALVLEIVPADPERSIFLPTNLKNGIHAMEWTSNENHNITNWFEAKKK